jgi:hypothetical protein
MKRLFRTFCLASLALFFATSLSAATDTQALGSPAGSIAVPMNLTAPEVQEALIKSADGRGWILVSRDDEKVVVRLDKNDWSARIAMLYNTREVQFFSNSTRKGKPKLPEGWIKYLKEDANRIMSSSSVLKK